MPLIRLGFDPFKEVEKRMHFKFWDKERERSNRAKKLSDDARSGARRTAICPLNHDKIAWVGPPHDSIRSYVCLDCKGMACEPEIKDRGYDFDTVPDWIIHDILYLDLERQAKGNSKTFSIHNN